MGMGMADGLRQVATHNLAGRRLNGMKGSTDRDSMRAWPSYVLHQVGPRMVDGLDGRRLNALADLIEGLHVQDTSGSAWAQGPVSQAKFVDGALPVLGYLVEGSRGRGWGVICHGPEGTGYYLTGYGLVCWGWGCTNGIASVAANGMAAQVERVLSAEPVRSRSVRDIELGQVTTAHVADALRHLVECRDADKAWWLASGLPVAPGAARPPEVGGSPPPAPRAPERAPVGLTGEEGWKALLMSEDYAGMAVVAERRVEALRGELARWERRLAVARAGMGEAS